MAGRDPVTGRNRQLSKTVRGSKTQARQRLNALVAEAQSGRYDGTSAVARSGDRGGVVVRGSLARRRCGERGRGSP